MIMHPKQENYPVQNVHRYSIELEFTCPECGADAGSVTIHVPIDKLEFAPIFSRFYHTPISYVSGEPVVWVGPCECILDYRAFMAYLKAYMGVINGGPCSEAATFPCKEGV